MKATVDMDRVRVRALELHREGLGCRRIADRLASELKVTVSKTAVNGWLQGVAGGAVVDAAPAASPDASGHPQADVADASAGRSPDTDDVARAETVPAEVSATVSAPQPLDTYQERVEHVADLIASGRWRGRSTVRRLSAAWGIAPGTAWNYARHAALLCKTDRGGREDLRQVSLGRWEQQRRKALADGDIKAANGAQAGWDRASGVVEPGGAKIINVVQVPGVRPFVDLVMDELNAAALELGGEAVAARDRVLEKIRNAMQAGGARPLKALGSGS